MIYETVALLGCKATDKVTGFSGVVTSVSFDLYGCVQLVLTPQSSNDKLSDGQWFDVNRLNVSTNCVMSVPVFTAKDAKPENYAKGAAPKPQRA